MKNAALRIFGASSFLAMAACEPVDDGAATRARGWDPEKDGLSNVVLDHDRDVFVDIDETMSVADGCAKTTLDATQLLQDKCASCHDQTAPAQTPPTFNFVTDVAKMKSSMWTPAGGTAMRYITVGKPEESAIFLRAGSNRDMPPTAADRLTYSAVSVLHYWIENCL